MLKTALVCNFEKERGQYQLLSRSISSLYDFVGRYQSLAELMASAMDWYILAGHVAHDQQGNRVIRLRKKIARPIGTRI